MTLKIDRSFPEELQSLVTAANARLNASHAVERLWALDHRLWKQAPTDITNRLGWLTIIEYMKDRAEDLRTFATSAQKRDISDGSEHCHEELARNFARRSVICGNAVRNSAIA